MVYPKVGQKVGQQPTVGTTPQPTSGKEIPTQAPLTGNLDTFVAPTVGKQAGVREIKPDKLSGILDKALDDPQSLLNGRTARLVPQLESALAKENSQIGTRSAWTRLFTGSAKEEKLAQMNEQLAEIKEDVGYAHKLNNIVAKITIK